MSYPYSKGTITCYCLNPINQNYKYHFDYYMDNGCIYTYLSCNEDNSKNLLHREDGPAFNCYSTTEWFCHGLRHRIDGPAIENPYGPKFWYYEGKLHREDGPAIEYLDGFNEWYYNDEEINCKSNEEFLKIISMKAFL